eukprot:27644-Rhodomonas_salina.1
MGNALFRQWLADGNLLYMPRDERYFWLPASSVSFSALPHILPVNLSLSDSYLRVGILEPAFTLNAGSVTGRVLGTPYWAAAVDGQGSRAYRTLHNSAVGHWRSDGGGAHQRPMTGAAM